MRGNAAITDMSDEEMAELKAQYPNLFDRLWSEVSLYTGDLPEVEVAGDESPEDAANAANNLPEAN